MQPGSHPEKILVEGYRRFLRILYFVLFATVGLYWHVLGLLTPDMEPRNLGAIKPILLAMAGGTAVAVLCLRFARVAPLLEGPIDGLSYQLARLRFYYILCFVLSETVALYGFLLGFLGGTAAYSKFPFLAAAVLFVVCYPRMPTGRRMGEGISR